MKILVTGGAGFIGSAVVRHIIRDTQDSVINLDKLTYAGNLVRQAQEGKLDPTTPEGHAAVNNPDFIKAAGILYQDEVSKGVGDIDPESGKTITGKQLNNIMITPDGRGVVLGVEVTYDDGSKAVRPVTNNRTSAPDDQPKVMPINDFLKPAYQRAALAKHMIDNADQLRTSLGLTAGPDQVGYKKAVTELEKQHGQNRARISSSNAEDKDLQLDALDAQLEQSKAALADTFGMTSKAEDKEAGTPIKEWTGGDPERLQFVKEANQHGKLSSLLDSPAKMNTAFELWRQAVAKEEAAKQAAASAERIREIEGPKEPQRPSLAQARQLASANMATGSGKPPQPYGKPVDVMGLIKAHNQSNADKQASDGYGLYQHGYK